MRIGGLNQLVNIQQQTRTANNSGGAAITWSNLLTNVPASVEPLPGSEQLKADSMMATITHRVKMRYRPSTTITPKMRAIWVTGGSAVMQIVSVQNLRGSDRFLQLECLVQE